MDNEEGEIEFSTDGFSGMEVLYENISSAEIPWSKATNKIFFNSEPENLFIITKFELMSFNLEQFKTKLFQNYVYKNNCNGFNSKHIIKAFLDAPVHAVIKTEVEIPGEIDMMGEGGESDILSIDFLKKKGKSSLTSMEKELEALKLGQDNELLEELEIEEDVEFDYYLNNLNRRKKIKPVSFKDQLLLLEIRNNTQFHSLNNDNELIRIIKESLFDEKKYSKEEEVDGEVENEEETQIEEVIEDEINDEDVINTEIGPTKLDDKKQVSDEFFLSNYYTGKHDEELVHNLSNVNPDYYVVRNEKLFEPEVEFPLPRAEHNYKTYDKSDTKWDEAITLLENKPQNILEFESMMYSSNFMTLKNCDLPRRMTEDKNIKAIAFMKYKTLLDYLQSSPENDYATQTFSKDEIKSEIGFLEKGRIVDSVPEERDLKVIFKDEESLEDYELFELIMDGKLISDFLGEKGKTALEAMQLKDATTSNVKNLQSQSQINQMQNIVIGTEEEQQFTEVKKLKIKEDDLKDSFNGFPYSYVRKELSIINSVKPAEDIFHIVTTGKHDASYPIGKLDKESKYHIMNSCGTVIFDISRSRKEMPDAWYYLKQYIELETQNDMQSPDIRHMILITNFLSWSKSDPNILQNISELNFLKRKCHPDYRDFYHLENFVYKIGLNAKFNLKTTIIFSGIPFGHEEDVLAYLFKLGWDNDAEIPIWTSGENILPIIHIDDLAKIVLDTVNKHLYPYMVFAISPNYQSLIELAKAIVENLGSGKIRHIGTKNFNERMCIPKIVYDLLQLNIKFLNVNDAIKSLPKYQVPFENFTFEIIQELKVARKLKDITIVLLGPPSKIKFEIGIMLSKFYDVPFFHTNNIFKKYLKLITQTKKRPSIVEELGEELMGEVEDEKVKPVVVETNPEVNALKKMIDFKVKDVNRQWLALCLKKLLKTPYVKNHGYILIDFPVRAQDAEYIFKVEDKYESEGESVAPSNNFSDVTMPEYVFVIDAPVDFSNNNYMIFENLDAKTFEELRADLNEYIFYRNSNKSVHNFFEFMNHRSFAFDVLDGPDILTEIVNIIGDPRSENGLTEYWSFLKYARNQGSYNLDTEKQILKQKLKIAEIEAKNNFIKADENLYIAKELLLEPNKFEMKRKYDGRVLKEKMKSETEMSQFSL